MIVSGSDGNLYWDNLEGQLTGSLYKTRWVSWTDTEFDDDGETNHEPGILFDTDNNIYWADVQWNQAHIFSGSNIIPTYSEDTNEGCIWVYELTDDQKTTIENDAQFIAKLVDSNL